MPFALKFMAVIPVAAAVACSGKMPAAPPGAGPFGGQPLYPPGASYWMVWAALALGIAVGLALAWLWRGRGRAEPGDEVRRLEAARAILQALQKDLNDKSKVVRLKRWLGRKK